MATWTLPTKKPVAATGQTLNMAAPTSYVIPALQSTPMKPAYQPVTAPQAPAATSASSLNNYFGGLNNTGAGTPASSVTTKSPYSTPAQTSPSQSSAAAQTNMKQPGAYENWYAQNAARYNQPTALNSYYQSVQGRLAGHQAPQPTNMQSAYSTASQMYSQPSQGANNARGVAGELRNQSAGEGVMSNALGFFGGPNQTMDAYAGARDFYGQSGDIEDYYAANAGKFQTAGQGENYAGNVLRSQQFGDISGMLADQNYGDQALGYMRGATAGNQRADSVFDASGEMLNRNTVGAELDYFRDPLRNLSYSEQLYESGNDGLNTFYDRELQKRKERMENDLASKGLFGSGEIIKGMYELEGELGAAQARDMAGLAGQADDQRLSRASQLTDMASAASGEELARRDLYRQMGVDADQVGIANMGRMQDAYGLASDEGIAKMQQYLAGQGVALDAADTALTMDRDAISRLVAGGNLANQSSTYALNRTDSGMNAANLADQSRFAQGEGMATIGNNMATASRNRLTDSAKVGLDADTEERLRMDSLFGQAQDLDKGYLDSDQRNRDWMNDAAAMANNVDQGNLAWLNGGGAAARGAQDAYQNRVGQLYNDTADLGNKMADTFGQMSAVDASEQAGIRMGVINLLQAQYGMDAASAERQAQEWMQMGMLPLQVYMATKGGG